MPRAARGRSSGGGSSAPSLWGGGNSTPPPVAPPPVVDNTSSGVSTSYRSTSQRQAGVETGLSLDAPTPTTEAYAEWDRLARETSASTGAALDQPPLLGDAITMFKQGAGEAARATGASLDQPAASSEASYREFNAKAISDANAKAKLFAPRPGVTTVDVTSPAGLGASLGKSLQQQGDMLSGLNTTLFGGATSLPFVGPIIKGITGVPGTVVDTAANVANLLGSGAARLPSGTMLGPFVGLSQGGAGMTEVATRFNAAPDSPEKQRVIAAMAKDPATAGHLATEFLKALAQEQQAVNPQLFPEYSVPSGSFLDDLGTAFSLPGVTSRLAERTVAGIPKLTGKDRIDEIIAVEEGGSYTGVLGTGAFAGKEKNTPIETLAAQNVISGVWTRAQALDFLSASGAGVSHDQALEIAGQIALDPQVWGSLGASAASKLGTVTMRLLRGGEGVALRAASPETLLVQGAQELGVPLEQGAARTFFRTAAQAAKSEGFVPARRSLTWVADLSDEGLARAASKVPGLEALPLSDVRGLLGRAAEEGVARARLNVLGHLAASDRVPPIMRAIGGTVYDPITQAGLGRAAKVVRTIIDPLHAIGGNHVIGETTVGLTSEAVTRVMVNAHGPTAMANVARIVSGVSADLGEKLFQDVGTYSANASRLVLLRTHVNNSLRLLVGHTLPRTAEEARLLVSDLAENAPKNWPDLLKQHFVNVREMLWDDAARTNLAERMAAQYGHADKWPSILAKLNSDELSILHAATYGRATAGILDALRAGRVEVGEAAAAKLKLARVILLNRRTLTDLGAKSILDSITPEGLALAAKDAKFTRVVHNAVTGIDTVVGDEAAYVQSLLKSDGTPFTSVQEYVRTAIADAQRTYPELNYVKIDPQNLGPTMEHFTNNLRFQVENGHLPHQFTDIEVAQMPQAVRDFNDRNAGVFNLGLTPSEDHLMGLVPDGDAIGGYVLGRDPWPDHVAVSNPGYRGTYAMRANAAGMPIPGAVGRTLDHIEAASQALTARVSSAVINLDATKRFTTNVMLKHPDVSQAEASGMIRAIQDAAQVHKTTVRGLEASNIWKAILPVIPDRLRLSGTFGQRELLNFVLDAYEGDLRFVGLTQKFTGRAKALFGRSGSNFAGHISEDLYTRIRFRYNPLFQTQETIEPWALGAQRGINPAFGRTLTPEDRIAETANRNLRNTSVSRASDMPDQAEQAAAAMLGQDMDKMLRTSASPNFWARVTDVQAGKRINEIRALRTNWGATARASFEATHPGTWDAMKVVAEQNAGHLLSDDEFFIRYLGEQSMAGDVKVSAFVQPGEGAAAFARATRTNVYHSPTSIGEVQGLELPRLVESLGFTLKDGTEIRTVDDLRAALAAKTIDNDRIVAAMNDLNSHPDYIRRVTNALDFHWDKFWQDARESYNLTAAETRSLKDMIAGSARVRGMTPVDYASQFWAPTILRGQKASVEALAGAVSILRAPKEGATIDTLVNQMVDVFHHHLDPSGEATLRAAFDAERGIVPAAARADRLSGIGEEARAAFEATGGRPAPAFRPGQGSAEQFTVGEEARQAYEARGGAAGVERRVAAAERRVAQQPVEVERRVEPRRVPPEAAAQAATPPDFYGPTSGSIYRQQTVTEAYNVLGFGAYHSGGPGVFFADSADLALGQGSGAAGPVIQYDAATLRRLDPRFSLQRNLKPGQSPAMAAEIGGEWVGSVEERALQAAATKVTLPTARPASLADRMLLQKSLPETLTRQGFVETSPGAWERTLAPAAPAVPPEAWTPAHTDALAAEITGAASGVDRASLPEPFAALDLHVTDSRNLAQIKKVGLQPDANGRVYYWPEGGVDAAAMSEVMGTKGVKKPPLVIGIRDGILQYNEDPAVFSGEAAFHKGAVSPNDLFIQQPDGSWKPLVAPKPVNPDVVRTGTAQFSKWAKAALKDGLLKDDPQYSDLLTKLTGIPTEGAVPYNQMHQLLVNQLGNGMAMGSEDAFRLTYFAKNRTMLERSLNHPFFGLYPASYMYGKILPELVRFMAQTPFGVRTGAAAYIGNDVARAIALQREFDPDFDKMMNDLGHSEIGWILGYMLPALPQDIGAAWPSWARDLAQQGLDNQARAQRGEPQKPIDLLSPFKKLGDYLNPLRPGMQLERPLGEIGDIAFGSAEERKARSPEGIAAAEKKARAATDKAARDAADLQAARDKRDAGIAANQARLVREKKARDKKLAVVGPQQGPPAPQPSIDIAPVDRVSNMLQSQPPTVPAPVTPQAGLGGVGVNAMDDLRRVLAGL